MNQRVLKFSMFERIQKKEKFKMNPQLLMNRK